MYHPLYRLCRTLWLFFGLAWLSIVIAAKQNTIQEFINQREQRFRDQEHQKVVVRHSSAMYTGENHLIQTVAGFYIYVPPRLYMYCGNSTPVRQVSFSVLPLCGTTKHKRKRKHSTKTQQQFFGVTFVFALGRGFHLQPVVLLVGYLVAQRTPFPWVKVPFCNPRK